MEGDQYHAVVILMEGEHQQVVTVMESAGGDNDGRGAVAGGDGDGRQAAVGGGDGDGRGAAAGGDGDGRGTSAGLEQQVVTVMKGSSSRW